VNHKSARVIDKKWPYYPHRDTWAGSAALLTAGHHTGPQSASVFAKEADDHSMAEVGRRRFNTASEPWKRIGFGHLGNVSGSNDSGINVPR
jgi:hypothetical protein